MRALHSSSGKNSKGGKDSKYFSTTKKGEISELKNDLNNINKDIIKGAVKKVIALMTIGKDVSSLFPDVVRSMQTDDIELKKLIYLYIINYARVQPEKAILVVNTIQKDAQCSSPIIRALAIRTMGCIRVNQIVEYLCDPLAQGLKDPDPYVRKTAAVCTAKLYDMDTQLVEERGFLDTLRKLISDSNPMVVANAVSALAEIADHSQQDVFKINSIMLTKLLAALAECTEWGQVVILDCLSKYEPSASEAQDIIDRVVPRLKHANSAVAMSAVKVIMKYLNFLDNSALEQKIVNEKLAPPMITLLAAHKPEIQYVTLRNIILICQKRPQIFNGRVKHFFCKYNDPLYVKMEKLEILIMLVDNKTIDQVLMELKEYAISEVDVNFVRKTVSTIGRCAIKLEKVAERCIRTLMELVDTKVNYISQEAIIVITDIFRKYPNRYESVISKLCDNLDTLDEPQAKRSMIWLIGEYSDRIDNAPELLETFTESFECEASQVQLQILTAVVKLFLKRPDDAKQMVTDVLQTATETRDNPDLRDRAFIYWRLLSTDPNAAKIVVLTERPSIEDDTSKLDEETLDILIASISTVASVFHKPAEMFLKDGKTSISLKSHSAERKAESESESSSSSDEESGETDEESDENEGDDEEEEEKEEKKEVPTKRRTKAANTIKLTHSEDEDEAEAPQMKVLLTKKAGSGLQISASYSRSNKTAYMNMRFENFSDATLDSCAMRFDQNDLGCEPKGKITVGPLNPNDTGDFDLKLVCEKTPGGKKPGIVRMAIKTNLGVKYFHDSIPPYIFFSEEGMIDKQQFLGLWKSLPDDKEVIEKIDDRKYSTVPEIKSKLAKHNIFFIARRKVKDSFVCVYFSLQFRDVSVLVELAIKGKKECEVCAKCDEAKYSKLVVQMLVGMLTA